MATKLTKYRNLKISILVSVMATLLMAAYGQKENWFEILLLSYVILINLYYNAEYITLLRSNEDKKGSKQRSPEEIEVLRNYALQSDMAMVKVGSGATEAYDAKGGIVIWDLNIRDSVGMLPKGSFFKVKRSCLVRRDIINEVIHDQDAGRVRLTLVKPFKDVFDLPKEEMVGFLEWHRRN